MNEKPKKVIVGLDVGTTKICTIVASCNHNSELEIIGIGSHPSHGLKKGSVVNMENTVKSIKFSLEEARLMAGVDITKVNIGIAGSHIYSFNSSGVVAIKNYEVTSVDVARVIEASRAIVVPSDREILHIIPQEFKVDSLSGIKDPIGMRGSRLEVKVHIVTGSIPQIQNLINCAEQAGVEVEGLTLQPMASSEAVLGEEEKNLGVVLVDIGGGTTDIAIWKDGGLVHSQIIPVGGNHFTNDLAVGLKIPHHEAEKIKIDYGTVIGAKLNSSIHITLHGLPGTRPREAKLVYIAEILAARAEELFETIKEIVAEREMTEKIVGGYVFTGGGALMKSLPELAEYVLERPTKIGFPVPFGGMTNLMQNPKFSTVLGLLIENQKNTMQKENKFGTDSKKIDLIGKLGESLKNVFKEIF